MVRPTKVKRTDNFKDSDFMRAVNNVLINLLLVVTVSIVLVLSLRLWNVDLRMPLIYWGDTLWLSIPTKSFLLNSSFYSVSQLSAPYGLSYISFPSNTHIDWMISGVIALLTGDFSLGINVLWFLTVAFTSLTANFALRALGGNQWFSFCGALIYAFLPYAFIRNVGHITLVYYVVPLLCMLAIGIAQGLWQERKNRLYLYIGYAACAIQGLSYVYFSFFGVVVLIFSGFYGYVLNRNFLSIRRAAISAAIIVLFSAINLSPSLLSWYENGKPNMGTKVPAEAEYYGLKIRRLLVPHPENPIYPLAKWAQKDAKANFPNENENITARLGIYSSLGFLMLLAISMRLLRRNDEQLKTLSDFSLFTLLIITVGGFGSVFNVLISPQIRSYNRFSVFLAFFAIAGATSLLTDFLNQIESITRRRMILFFTFFIIIFSLYDQCLEGNGVYAQNQHDKGDAIHDKALVAKMEEVFPASTSVFQLPLTSFPDRLLGQMKEYEHARPFFWSKTLKWSWPTFSLQHEAWDQKITQLSGTDQLEALVLSGFGAIWIDRFGYEDRGEKIIQDLIAAGATSIPEINDERITVLNLQSFAEKLKSKLGEKEFNLRADKLLNFPVLKLGSKIYGVEKDGNGIPFHWSQQESDLTIQNISDKSISVDLSFYLVSHTEGSVSISVGDEKHIVKSLTVPTPFETKIPLKPKEKKKISFSTNLARVDAPQDPRELYFMIRDLKITQNKF